MDLPYFDTCHAAFERAKEFITTGLSPINHIEELNETHLLFYSEPKSEGYSITYDNENCRMTDIQSFVVDPSFVPFIT